MYQLKFLPKPSKWLFFILFVLHGLAFAVLACANIELIWQILLGAILLLGGYYWCWRQALCRGSRVIVRCVVLSDRWWLTDLLGREYEAELAGDSLVTSVLIILNFRVAGSGFFVPRPRLILCPDSLDTDTLRCLRVLLLSH